MSGARAKLAVIRDIGYVSFAKYGQYVVTLVTLPLAARLLGTSGMGLLAIGMSAFFLGSLLTDLGITPYLAARVEEPRLDQLRGDFAGLRLAVAAALGCAWAATATVWPEPHAQMIALGLLGGSLSSSGDDWVLVGKNRFGAIMLLYSAGRAVYLAALLALLPLFPTATTAMACLIVSTLIPVAGSWSLTIREHGLPRRPGSPAALLRAGGPVLASRLLENTYEQGAATMFAPALSIRSIGLFSGGDRPVQAAGSLLDAIGWSMIPRMARRRDRAEDFWPAATRGAGAVALVGAAGAAIGCLLAPWVVLLIFGGAFTDSIALLRLEVWALPGKAVASFFSTAVLPARGDARGVLCGSAIGAAVAAGALLVALGTRSPTTAAIGVVAAETAAAIFYLARAGRIRRREHIAEEQAEAAR